MHEELRREQLRRDLRSKTDREVAEMAYIGMWFHVEKCDAHSKLLAKLGWAILTSVLAMLALKLGDFFHISPPPIPGLTH